MNARRPPGKACEPRGRTILLAAPFCAPLQNPVRIWIVAQTLGVHFQGMAVMAASRSNAPAAPWPASSRMSSEILPVRAVFDAPITEHSNALSGNAISFALGAHR
jgi:hypothetical protein